MKIAVSEIFGPTFQGEGPSLGTRATFLRLAMCNLKCEWCDTKYTWDWEHYDKNKEVRLLENDHVVDSLMRREQTTILVITGGEPMLQQIAIEDLCRRNFISLYDHVEIETNGTISPRWDARFLNREAWYNVSPKLSNSGNDQSRAINDEAINWHARRADSNRQSRFKFVAEDVTDLNEISAFCRLFRIEPELTWIMPLGTTPEQIDASIDNIKEEVLERRWNLTTRLHINLWNNVRGH